MAPCFALKFLDGNVIRPKRLPNFKRQSMDEFGAQFNMAPRVLSREHSSADSIASLKNNNPESRI